jgi:excisionase family DNA binding protein
MAGMFYSLKEVAEKLGKTEQEVREIVRKGRLREFRDGPNLLFKVDEVEALLSDTSIMASQEAPVESPQAGEDEISLAPEPAEPPAGESGLTGADTAMVDEGINVLGETDSDYQLAGDTLGETKAASDATEASMEEIEEDVNLDTFGSGSGLLDLSLQADDTSLGGILDEIYTPEAGAGEQPAEASAVEVAAQAEEMLPGEEIAGPQPVPLAPAAALAYAEPEPDPLSNAFGIMLFLPLLVIIYTAVVTVGGFNDVMPGFLKGTQGMIWYIMGGVAVAAGLIVGIAFMLRSGGKTAKPKVKKAEKPKKEKKSKNKKEAKS